MTSAELLRRRAAVSSSGDLFSAACSRGKETCPGRSLQSHLGCSRTSAATRLKGVSGCLASLDFARSSCYQRPMIKCSRKVNLWNMTRFGWAVEGVVR